MGSFWGDAWTSFKAVYGPVLTVAAFVLALLGAFYDPRTTVEIRVLWLAVILVVLLGTTMTAINMLTSARETAHRLASGNLPKVLYVDVGPTETGGPEPVTILLDRSALFALNQFVAIRYAEPVGTGRVFERSIGTGYVLHIQIDGFIQVRVSRTVSDQTELWQRIKKCEPQTLAQVAIRPSIATNEIDTGVSVE